MVPGFAPDRTSICLNQTLKPLFDWLRSLRANSAKALAQI
jgi:hypothetical protein